MLLCRYVASVNQALLTSGMNRNLVPLLMCKNHNIKFKVHCWWFYLWMHFWQLKIMFLFMFLVIYFTLSHWQSATLLFAPYSDTLHQANLETLSGRRQSITNKLFNSITCNSDHKLHQLLPPRNNCEFNLRRKKNFHVPLAKTKRLKNTFIYSNCN